MFWNWPCCADGSETTRQHVQEYLRESYILLSDPCRLSLRPEMSARQYIEFNALQHSRWLLGAIEYMLAGWPELFKGDLW